LAALTDQTALELRDDAEHLREHATYRRDGLNGLGQAAKGGAGRVDASEDAHEIHEATSQAVELVDDHLVSRLKLGQKKIESRSGSDTATLFLNDSSDTSPKKGSELQ
jgi:hypothetical protein